VIQPLLTVECTVERAPGCWPLSSPCRRRRWPAGQALQGAGVPGYDRRRRTDGLGSRPCARANPLAARYITHSKFNRAKQGHLTRLDGLIEKIDYKAAISHALSSVAAAGVIRHPFPYVILENVFDPRTYDALLELVELDHIFYDEIGGKEADWYTIFRYPEVRYRTTPQIGDFIDFLATRLNSAIFSALLSKFCDEPWNWGNYLREQRVYLKQVATLARTEVYPNRADGVTHEGMQCWLEIMCRTRDFNIRPHCHPVHELLIGIYPITSDNSLEAYRTELFELKRGQSMNMDMRHFSYIDEAKVKRVTRTKFLPNSCFMMLNSRGIHAYNPPENLPRPRNYIYTTLHIPDADLERQARFRATPPTRRR
jgi:hypothetical protein